MLLSGREKRLPEGGYKKTREAGGHVERLSKRSKHSLADPAVARDPRRGKTKRGPARHRINTSSDSLARSRCKRREMRGQLIEV